MKRHGHILLVDDDPNLRRLLALRIKSAGHEVSTAENAAAALKALREKVIDCVITDLLMDGMNGIDLLQHLSRERPTLPVILITAHGSIPDAVTATQGGALDFLTKPVDKQALLARIEQALAQAGPAPGLWEDIVPARMITRAPAMHRLLDEARLVADTETSILIRGESGTGKEVLARVLHEASRRRERPFLAINCGAMPEQLLESELFGHVKGAFTDAHKGNEGLLRSANGGTVLLDEIGDMPHALQVKLLRVLQEREVRPVGASTTYPIDIRILSATHRDLARAISAGSFREDLYYRLAVVNLHLPPLRDRIEDIAPLCHHFLQQLAARDVAPANVQPKVYAPEAMELLMRASWPGNIRQLANVVEQNAALTPGRVIPAQVVEKALADHAINPTTTASIQPLAQARDLFIRDYLIQLLQITAGNVTRAARLAERNRTEFYKLLARHDVDPADFKHVE
ncbi:MAG TPA: sigma 54-interacting transcriptional regulator [Salinisphaeraceae bacterium]|nr:sigma 54-interacting transcriptional regulator [Salinisphaeraceae bacterium]